MSTYRYSSQVLYHFWNARNAGEIDSPDGIGTATNGRISMQFTLRITRARIVAARFRCTNCLVAVACCEWLSELVRDMSLAQTLCITPDRLARELGEIPEERQDRCELAVAALVAAVQDHRSKKSDACQEVTA